MKQVVSFATDFSFHEGAPIFGGFLDDDAVARSMNLKYRVLVRNPTDNHLYTMKGMEEPLSPIEIDKVLKERYGGSIAANEFAFEVFSPDNKLLFATLFNARERSSKYDPDKFTVTSFRWHFDVES